MAYTIKVLKAMILTIYKARKVNFGALTTSGEVIKVTGAGARHGEKFRCSRVKDRPKRAGWVSNDEANNMPGSRWL
ncbi:hypothetical protein A2W24_02460 [Microgenomates group bacterium RBG_16_45_19]|nr:MAG: hypothetical protein A2W24_02460 [Microgenomates group bacterium RBG_16_45_19]